MEMVNRSTRKTNQLTLWLLLLVFGLPPLAGWLLYLNPQWLPSGRSNHGELINPPRMLQDITVIDTQGHPVGWGEYRNFWTLTAVSRGTCSDDCQKQLSQMRQVLRAIGASRTRVKQLLIMLPSHSGGAIPTVPEDQAQDIEIVQAQGEAAQKIAERFDLDNINARETTFVISPDATLMMRHDLSTITPKQVMQDLETLLTATQNWVRGT